VNLWGVYFYGFSCLALGFGWGFMWADRGR
jgi:hypothetical protein